MRRATSTGVLPLYHSRSPLTGSHLSTLEEGILAIDTGAAAALLVRARSLSDEIGAKYLQVRGGMIDKAAGRKFKFIHTFIDTSKPKSAYGMRSRNGHVGQFDRHKNREMSLSATRG